MEQRVPPKRRKVETATAAKRAKQRKVKRAKKKAELDGGATRGGPLRAALSLLLRSFMASSLSLLPAAAAAEHQIRPFPVLPPAHIPNPQLPNQLSFPMYSERNEERSRSVEATAFGLEEQLESRRRKRRCSGVGL